jgi:hypothetical protein
MQGWQPATVDEVRQIVNQDLKACDAEQLAAFQKYSVQLDVAPIVRYGKRECVIVVARKANEVIYWEDVEEGFNLSPVDAEGQILEHWCNQDDLGLALNHWIEGRGPHGRFGPATSLH